MSYYNSYNMSQREVGINEIYGEFAVWRPNLHICERA